MFANFPLIPINSSDNVSTAFWAVALRTSGSFLRSIMSVDPEAIKQYNSCCRTDQMDSKDFQFPAIIKIAAEGGKDENIYYSRL